MQINLIGHSVPSEVVPVTTFRILSDSLQRYATPINMEFLKRKLSSENEGPDNKKPRQGRPGKPKFSKSVSSKIEPGDAGIWATCDRHKEGRAIAELEDLFARYAVKLYGETCLGPTTMRSLEQVGGESLEDAGDRVDDIESEIARELHSLRSKPKGPAHENFGQVSGSQLGSRIFQPIRIGAPCLVFFKTQPPIQPESFVHSICRDAADGTSERMSRFVKRLTPVTKIGRATEAGLDEVGKEVLGPVFGIQKGLKVGSFQDFLHLPSSTHRVSALERGNAQGWLACRLHIERY